MGIVDRKFKRDLYKRELNKLRKQYPKTWNAVKKRVKTLNERLGAMLFYPHQQIQQAEAMKKFNEEKNDGH